jgi:c-di-GMP-binding flagellar brake protein YcgR
MAGDRVERRRSPRAVILSGDRSDLSLPVSTTVQLMDISQSGVLLSSSQKLGIGQRAQRRTRGGPDPLTVQVEVRRVANGGRAGHGSYKLGAEFVALDEENQRKIERFLKVEP